MIYRDFEYSVSDTGNAQWRGKIHRELDVDVTTPALFGRADTKEEAIAKAMAAIDDILERGATQQMPPPWRYSFSPAGERTTRLARDTRKACHAWPCRLLPPFKPPLCVCPGHEVQKQHEAALG
jgi:hypothetical protein